MKAQPQPRNLSNEAGRAQAAVWHAETPLRNVGVCADLEGEHFFARNIGELDVSRCQFSFQIAHPAHTPKAFRLPRYFRIMGQRTGRSSVNQNASGLLEHAQ